MIVNSDISITFSGGNSNASPEASLGGEPSLQVITNKRLFSNITKTQATNGYIDYRCFYINNDNNVDSLLDVVLSIADLTGGEVISQLGFIFSDEQQIVTIFNANTVTSGHFTLTYTDAISEQDIVVPWDSDAYNLALALQTGLRELLNLEEITVDGSLSGTTITLEINFVGTAGNRFHDILTLKTNALDGSSSIGISKSIDGSPINSIADEIDVETTVPNGIEFISVSADAEIGDLRALDSVPVWVQRTIPPDTTAIESDGFTFNISGSTTA